MAKKLQPIVEKQLLKITALAEAKTILEDKGKDYEQGFLRGCLFMNDYSVELLKYYSNLPAEGEKDGKTE